MPQTTHTRDYVPPLGTGWDAFLAALLAPIPGERPSGEPLRYEGTYDRINDARREDDPRLAQGVWERDLKRADWPTVAQLCGEALELRSKDLQIAAWLMEAWCKLYGFAGAEAGLKLIDGLCRTYWNDLYPGLDDAEYRAAPFHWINEKLSIQLKFIPLSQVSDLVPVAFTWADWEAARRAEQQQLQTGTKASGVTPSQIQAALQRSSPEFLASEQAHLAGALMAAAELEAWLDTQFQNTGGSGPGLRLFRATLEEIQHELSQIPATLIEPAPMALAAAASASVAAPAGESAVALTAPAPPPSTGGPIQSREDAYRRLAEAAAYLLRTEPHSPTPYLVNRAIRWGHLPLDQLLPEMVRNDSALGELRQLLNLKAE